MGQLQKKGLKSYDAAFSLVATEAPTEFSFLWDRVCQDFAPGRSGLSHLSWIIRCNAEVCLVSSASLRWILDRWHLSDGAAPPVHEVWLPACLS